MHEDRHPGTQHLMRHLAVGSHLPDYATAVARGYLDLANLLLSQAQDGPELTVALRGLLDSKTAALRALVDTHRD